MSVFGVDLGCRNCVVGVTRGGIDIICNEVSKRETASYVSLGDDLRQIGENGLDKAVRSATNTVSSLKRFVGMRKGDPRLARELEFVFAPTTFDAEGRLQFEMEYAGETKVLYPEQLLAMLLGKLRSYVAIETSADIKNVRDCAVSVPAWYSAEQRKLTMQACEIAGLNAMTVVNENTAALVDYGIFRDAELPKTVEEAQHVALIDIGYAGTTVSIAKFWHGNVRVLATACAQDLGTRDIDYDLMKHFAVEIEKKYKVDVLSSRRPMLRVLQACEKVKNMLSANFLAPLNIECIMDVDVNFNDFNRDQLEVILAPLVERLQALLERAAATAGVEKEKIQIAEMIGGGCRVPAFKNAVQTFFGVPPRFTLNASECIARGCTVTAAVFSPHMRVREFVVHEKPLLPICLGLKADEAPVASSVPFLPEVNLIRTVLRENDEYPKTEEVVITNQKQGFDAHLFYDAHHANAAAANGCFMIASYSVGFPARKELTGEVTLVVKMHPSGLATIESARGVETYEVEETVVPEKKEGEDAAEPQKVKKTKTRRVELVVSAKTNVIGLSEQAVAEAVALEAVMEKRDKEICKTREEKNALESYIFENRPRIVESSGMLHDFVLPEERVKFGELATKFEEWLYDDGAEAAFADYQSRLSELRAIGEPAFKRHKAHDDMPFHVSQFEKELQKQTDKLTAAKGKQAHITDADLDAVIGTVQAASAWAKSQLAAVAATPKTQDVTFSQSQLDAKLKEIYTAVVAVLSKKPPPPPKKEEAPKEAPATDAAAAAADGAAPPPPPPAEEGKKDELD
jgi:heat shock protein 4